MSFFKRVTSLQESGESLGAYSKRMKIPYNSLIAWRGGSEPHGATVRSLAKKLGVDPGWLSFGTPNSTPKNKAVNQ